MKRWSRWEKVGFLAFMAFFVSPYLFVAFYPSLSGATTTQAITIMNNTLWNPLVYRVWFFAFIILGVVAYLLRRRRPTTRSGTP